MHPNTSLSSAQEHAPHYVLNASRVKSKTRMMNITLSKLVTQDSERIYPLNITLHNLEMTHAYGHRSVRLHTQHKSGQGNFPCNREISKTTRSGVSPKYIRQSSRTHIIPFISKQELKTVKRSHLPSYITYAKIAIL